MKPATMKPATRNNKLRLKSLRTNQLKELGLSFTSHNDGVHLKLTIPGIFAEYWPTTDRWHVEREWGHGFAEMLKALANHRNNIPSRNAQKPPKIHVKIEGKYDKLVDYLGRSYVLANDLGEHKICDTISAMIRYLDDQDTPSSAAVDLQDQHLRDIRSE